MVDYLHLKPSEAQVLRDAEAYHAGELRQRDEELEHLRAIVAPLRDLREIILADRDRISQRYISDETLACLSGWLSDYEAAEAAEGTP